MKNDKFNCEVAVIGGGPAGMMAAIAAAQRGAKTILLEKNAALGKKLLLTGGGRGNFCNAESDLRKLAANYGQNGPFLFHSFSQFGPKEAIEFFNGLGVKTKIENNNRVFPKSDRAADILNALIAGLNGLNVEIVCGARITGIEKENNSINKIVLDNRDDIVAKNYIIATGGKSYPQTGSAGDGYLWAQALGHKIDPLSPALVPVGIKEEWIKDLAGVALENPKISAFQNGKKLFSARGEMLFAHFGVSGPAILNIGGAIAGLAGNGAVFIHLDFLPEIINGELQKKILENFQKNPNKTVKNCLADFVPAALAPAICRVAAVDAEKTANNVEKKERRRLVETMKNFKLEAGKTFPVESGMITGGGVNVAEIDHKTMRSKIIRNLFFAGEIINVHGPTGGFNLLQCWSTGRLAGREASLAHKK
ncbi:MAG TPA: NAD(P)/FAD-dependent oxidoreductase [Candidatus Pacearchaeota archaeon]|nr:NAD(P)/FAD-dependent oxidoreductase [Candidatus Pacearchaeota archaeon]